jgi:hypothetical protein
MTSESTSTHDGHRDGAVVAPDGQRLDRHEADGRLRFTHVDGDGRDPAIERQLARVRDENEHLHRAMRHRSVIEQAKGALMGWLGVDAEAAFGLLVGYSQRNNRKLAAAAVAVLEYAAARDPDPATALDLPNDLELFAELAQGQIDRWLDHAAVQGASDLESMLAEVAEVVSEPAPERLMIGALEPDGAVRILASRNLPAAVVTGWQRVPPTADVPVAFTAVSGQPVFLDSSEERIARFPGSRSIPAMGESLACVPIELAGLRLGVLALTWADPGPFDLARRKELLQLADRCAKPLADHLMEIEALGDALPHVIAEPGRSRWFHATLDDLPVAAMLLEPIRDEDGELVDLGLVHHNTEASAHLADPVRPSGRRFSEISPWLPESPLWPLLRATLEDGASRRLDRFELPVNFEGRRGLRAEDLHVSRVGSLLLLSWREMLEPGA